VAKHHPCFLSCQVSLKCIDKRPYGKLSCSHAAKANEPRDNPAPQQIIFNIIAG
jgi:hypothetical protein